MMIFALVFISISIPIALVVGRIIYIAVCNISAHKFFESKSSSLPVLRNTSFLSGHAFSFFGHRQNFSLSKEYHDRYGKTFGWYFMDKPIVNTIDLDLIKTYTLDEPDDHLDKGEIPFPIKELGKDSLLYANGETWRRLRKILAPAAAPSKFKLLEDEAKYAKEEFIKSIERKFKEAEMVHKHTIEIDSEDLMHRYTLSSIYGLFYRERSKVNYCDEIDEDLRKFNQCSVQGIAWKLYIIFFGSTRFFDPYVRYLHPLGEVRDNFVDFFKKRTKELTNIVKNDLNYDRRALAIPIFEKYMARQMTKSEYFSSSYFLFFAANKTTADAITATLYLLACYKSVQEKLRKSILENGADSEYLNWCILEAIRIYTPSMTGSSRILGRDIQTKHGLIPKGTCVIPSVWTIHRLTEYWGKDADIFRPERWVDQKNFHPCQFMAFGMGKRNCMGKSFAMFELRSVLDMLLRRYEFQVSPRTDRRFNYEAPYYTILILDNPCYLKVTKLRGL